METPQSHTLKFTGAISTDSKRIILASYTHYLVLSLFFLPLCAMISSLVFAIIFNDLNHLLELYSSLPHNILIYFIIYNIFGYTLTQCGIAAITYSTHHRILGNPMSLLTVLKSLKCTFFPIFFTSFLIDVPVVLITLTSIVFCVLVLMLGQALGFVTDHISFWYLPVLGAISLLGLISGVIIGMIHEKCSLACMVVVAESKWGFLALKRSWHLRNETRVLNGLPWAMWLGICIFCGGVGAVIYLILSNNIHLVISNLGFVSWTVFGSFFLMMVLLLATVKNSVFYYYRKVVHGELGVKIDQEYVHPPTDAEKVPHVVNVVVAA